MARGDPATGLAAAASARKAPNLNHPTYYINRELSWLQFNWRVLEEALDKTHPLLERARFLSIFASNLDEFYMIRVSGLRRQLAGGALSAPPDGMTPAQQLAAIRKRLRPALEAAAACWAKDLQPRLRETGLAVVEYKDLEQRQRAKLRGHFLKEIFPVLTPLAFDPGHPFPHISNLSINLAVIVRDPERGERFARVKVPAVFPRLVRIPADRKGSQLSSLGLGSSISFVWLEELVMANLDLLFTGIEIVAAYPFRVTRDADVEIEEDEAADLLSQMEEVVGQRHFGFAVRLEVDHGMPDRFRDILVENLGLAPYQVFAERGPLGLASLSELCRLDRGDLKCPPFLPAIPPAIVGEASIFSLIQKKDVLLYHPYDSFNPVVDFVLQAARDPEVLAIKQTLYRVGPNSPIVESLKEARENGKQVSALVELKARFDEAHNIVWARELERAGVHVVYGLMGLKTHAKMCLVVRREKDGIRRYTHLGTGNYNPETARLYGDLGLLTSRADIAEDVSDLFNALTGYSRKDDYRKLLVAPGRMRQELLARIDREVRIHRREGNGYAAFKLNALVDRACIKALYQASQAGVRIDLQVRGICCLRPQVPGVSENIRVTSLVGRFLEHSRIFYFRNGGNEEILLGSADLMPRNLDGRVEVLFPIEDARLRKCICDDILQVHLQDNVRTRTLQQDAEYVRSTRLEGRPSIDSISILLSGPGSWHVLKD